MTGKTRNYTDEFKRQIVALVKNGKSFKTVAEEYGIGKSTVTQIMCTGLIMSVFTVLTVISLLYNLKNYTRLNNFCTI